MPCPWVRTRRWVMSHTTRVSAVSGGLSRRDDHGERGQTTSRLVGAVPPISSGFTASGLQIGLQNSRLTCDLQVPGRPVVTVQWAGHVPGKRTF